MMVVKVGKGRKSVGVLETVGVFNISVSQILVVNPQFRLGWFGVDWIRLGWTRLVRLH
jgi:hypothetical protein